MNKKAAIKPKGRIFMAAGLLCILAAFSLTGYNLWDEYRAGLTSDNVFEQLTHVIDENPENPGDTDQEERIPDYILNPNMDMPTILIDGHKYIGILSIPALDITLPVMDQWSYPNLKIAPNRYLGSPYTDNFIIAAHNYRVHFGRLNTLAAGDRIEFTDVDANRFLYSVAEIEVMKGDETERMNAGDWDLTLFTCTLGGESRVTVRCEKTNQE